MGGSHANACTYVDYMVMITRSGMDNDLPD